MVVTLPHLVLVGPRPEIVGKMLGLPVALSVISRPGTDDAFERRIALHAVSAGINDPARLLACARRIHERRPIDAMIGGTERALLSVALAGEALGIRVNPSAAVRCAQDKAALRARLAEAAAAAGPGVGAGSGAVAGMAASAAAAGSGASSAAGSGASAATGAAASPGVSAATGAAASVATVAHRICPDPAAAAEFLAAHPGGIVLKPANGHGGQGVFVVRDPADLPAAWAHVAPVALAAGGLTAGRLAAGVLSAVAPTAGGLTAGGSTAGVLAAGGPTAGGPTAEGLAAGVPTAGGLAAGGPTAGGPGAEGLAGGGPTAGALAAGRLAAGGPTAGGPAAGGLAAEGLAGGVLAEEFLAGTEASVETMSAAGEHRVLAVTAKHTTGPPHRVEIAHEVPGGQSPAFAAAAASAALAALNAVGYAWGPAHTEVIVGDDGRAAVVEINARWGGDRIWEMLEPVTGVDMARACAMAYGYGELPVPRPGDGQARAVRYLTPDPGRVVSVTGTDDAAATGGVVRIGELTTIGAVLPPLADSRGRAGYVLAAAPDPRTAHAIASEAASRIRIQTIPTAPPPGTPAPGTPASSTPAPGTPAPGTPAPGTPASSTPTPGTPASAAPASSTPAPGTPQPAPGAPRPGSESQALLKDIRRAIRGSLLSVRPSSETPRPDPGPLRPASEAEAPQEGTRGATQESVLSVRADIYDLALALATPAPAEAAAPPATGSPTPAENGAAPAAGAPAPAEDAAMPADEIARLLRAAGAATAEVAAIGGTRPAVFARCPAPPGMPTVLLHGRGTPDGGAGTAVHLAALRFFGGHPPVGVAVVIEGETNPGPLLDRYRAETGAELLLHPRPAQTLAAALTPPAPSGNASSVGFFTQDFEDACAAEILLLIELARRHDRAQPARAV